MITLKKTPLHECHKKLNAKLVDFAGYEMPVQYHSIISEHNAVRTKAGLFDVSHMGEFTITGPDSLKFLNFLVPNDISKISEAGKGLYTQICYENGTTVDDLIIYNRGFDFLIVVNASNIDKDWAWVNSHKNNFNINLKNESERFSLIALQGPLAEEILSKTLKIELQDHKYFEIKKYNSTWIARTGYTGEDGFEIFIEDVNEAKSIWETLITNGSTPCGLGARDTLRLEAAYPLYGHELDDNTSPLEAGLGWSVKLDKEHTFIGKDSLLKQKQSGLNKKMVCLKIKDKVIARQGYKVYSKEEKEIGIVASGSQGLTVGYPIATAFVSPDFSEIGNELLVSIRDKMIPCEIVKRPFYKKSN